MVVILALIALMERGEAQLIVSPIAEIPLSVWIGGIVLTV